MEFTDETISTFHHCRWRCRSRVSELAVGPSGRILGLKSEPFSYLRPDLWILQFGGLERPLAFHMVRKAAPVVSYRTISSICKLRWQHCVPMGPIASPACEVSMAGMFDRIYGVYSFSNANIMQTKHQSHERTPRCQNNCPLSYKRNLGRLICYFRRSNGAPETR
jgi:hypothetical protein